LQDKIFNKSADIVIGEGAEQGSAQTEAATESTGHIIFPASFPSAERSGGADAAFAWIESEHDFAHGNLIEPT
jgi:hypothetical protein